MQSSKGRRDPVLAGIVVLCLIAATLAALMLGLYWRTFSGPLSKEQGIWGVFGDFIGGTLNPFLGFLSVVLLALTLREQRKFLVETKRQAFLEEFQRVLAAASQGLDEALRVALRLEGARFTAPAGASDLWGLCNVLVGFSTNEKPLPVAWLKALENSDDLQRVAIQFLRFVHLLGEYVQNGGSPKIAQLYVTGYGAQAIVMHALWPDTFPWDHFVAIGMPSTDGNAMALATKFAQARTSKAAE